ncbi:MAG: hypothetical protein V1818_00535 [Candidatus Aenigmatarchaeota archaeon]
MKGVSAIIVVILLTLISVSLVSLAYSFFGRVITETTETGSEAVDQASTSILSKIKIETISPVTGEVSVRNSGKVDVSQFAVFVNGALDNGATVPPSISPGQLGTITLSSLPGSGVVIKVTTVQGAIAEKSVP